jgi:hypothetical protein
MLINRISPGDFAMTKLRKKLVTAGKVLKEHGPTGVLRRALVVAADQAVSASMGLAAKLRKQSHYMAGFYGNRQLMERNRRFENLHRGRRAFVLGTGPSLARQDLSLLAGELTFAVNSFWKNPILAKWQPTYYCAVDADYFIAESGAEEALRKMSEVAAGSTFFVPLYGQQAVRHGSLPEARTYFLSFAGWVQDGNVDWPVLHRPLTATWNVVQTALLAALAMGCNPIYLLGCDHDWGAGMEEWGHFHPGSAFSPKVEAPAYPMTLVYRDAYYVFLGHEKIQKMCKAHGVSIFNATAGGRLDVYDRANYEALFSSGRTPIPANGLQSRGVISRGQR